MDLHLEPMTTDEYAAYRATAEDDYAASLRDSGALPEDRAREKARTDHARLLPDGMRSEGQRFWTAYDGDEPVGMVWIGLTPTTEGTTAYIHELAVREDRRRRGYGRAILEAVERECRALGAVSLSLNVFGHNLAARALYEQVGFRVLWSQMGKAL